ncbi:MAG: hypothetical protein LBH60_09940 [Prevotellaceae bacterium]|jgi:hypothetical protein|nr:hypothetical protein [Prevotellaceae bacterium]
MNNIQEADPFETASLAKTVCFIDPPTGGLAKTVCFIDPPTGVLAKTVCFINPPTGGLTKIIINLNFGKSALAELVAADSAFRVNLITAKGRMLTKQIHDLDGQRDSAVNTINRL